MSPGGHFWCIGAEVLVVLFCSHVETPSVILRWPSENSQRLLDKLDWFLGECATNADSEIRRKRGFDMEFYSAPFNFMGFGTSPNARESVRRTQSLEATRFAGRQYWYPRRHFLQGLKMATVVIQFKRFELN
jgi:hypothetical protein